MNPVFGSLNERISLVAVHAVQVRLRYVERWYKYKLEARAQVGANTRHMYISI